MAFRCLVWEGFEESAAALGVSSRVLRKYNSDSVGSADPLPTRMHRGCGQVQTGVVYLWMKKHSKCDHVKAPYDFEAWQQSETAGSLEKTAQTSPPPTSEPKNTDELQGANSLDVLKILEKALSSTTLPNEDRKIWVSVAESLRRNADSEDRRQSKVTRDDCIKKLRSLGEIYCTVIEAHASARAAAILRVIREQFSVDLLEKNTGALQILAAAECRFSNDHEMPAIRQNVKDQVEGVEKLEGVI